MDTSPSPRRPAFTGTIVKLLAAIVLLAGATGAAAMLLGNGKPEMPVEVQRSPADQLQLIAEAEASFTYTFTLGQRVAPRCGETVVPALEAASDAETGSDPAMAALAATRAEKRAKSITTVKSCGRALSEVYAADRRARAAHY